MIDIFSKPEQPKLYIADIIISAMIPTRAKKKKEYDKIILKIEKYPMVLVNGQIPTERIKQSLFKKIFDNYINKGEYDKIIFKIGDISNIKFSSNLAYEFDYSKH